MLKTKNNIASRSQFRRVGHTNLLSGAKLFLLPGSVLCMCVFALDIKFALDATFAAAFLLRATSVSL